MKSKCFRIVKSLAFLLLLLVTASNTLFAEKYSLNDLLNAAFDKNLELRIAQQQTRQFKNAHNQAFYNFFPDLNIQLGNRNNRGLFIDPSTNLLTRDLVYGTSGEINSEVILFRGMYNHRRYALTQSQLQASEMFENTRKQSIARDIVMHFYQIELLQNDIQQREEFLQDLEKITAFTKGRVQSGIVHQRELKMIEAENAEVSLQIIQNKLMIEEFLMHLQYHTGIENLQSENLEIETDTNGELEITEISDGESQNPYLAYYGLMTDVAEANLALRKAAGFPVLSLEGAAGSRTSSLREESYTEQFADNNYQYIGVRLRIPVFNRFVYRSETEKAKAGVEIARLQNQIAIREYELELNALQRRQNLMEAKLDMLAVKEEAFLSQFEYIQAQFQMGLTDVLEINQISRLINDNRTELVKTQIEIISNTLDIAFLKGNTGF